MKIHAGTGRWLAAVAGMGCVATLGCNTQRGWPASSNGALGYARWCHDEAAGYDYDYDYDNDPPTSSYPYDEPLDYCEALADHIAVSSRFRPRFEPSDRLPGAIKAAGMEPASREYLDEDGQDYVALREGAVALLALGTSEVIDYKLLNLHDVDWIAIDGPDLPPINAPIELYARPMGDGKILAGRMDWEWASLSEGLTIVEARGNEATIQVTTQGDVTFEVSVGGYTLPITFAAYRGPMRLPAQPSSDDDDGDDGFDPPGGQHPGDQQGSKPPGGGQ